LSALGRQRGEIPFDGTEAGRLEVEPEGAAGPLDEVAWMRISMEGNCRQPEFAKAAEPVRKDPREKVGVWSREW
jgi:hypothetical protein